MNGVNLISRHRLQQRKAAARVRLWFLVAPVSIGLLGAAYIVNAVAWETDTEAVATSLKEASEQIKQTEQTIAARKKALRESQAVLRANKAVGEQPDWGLMLSLLSSKLGDDAVLNRFAVEPVVKDTGARKPGETAKESGRPRWLKVSLNGLAKAQEGVSRFVLELEKTGVFDKVTLVETRRSEGDKDGVKFEIVCDLSDSGANVK